MDDFEDPVILKALKIAAGDEAEATGKEPQHGSEQNKEQDKDAAHKIEALQKLGENDIHELEDPAIMKALWMRASSMEGEEPNESIDTPEQNEEHEKQKLREKFVRQPVEDSHNKDKEYARDLKILKNVTSRAEGKHAKQDGRRTTAGEPMIPNTPGIAVSVDSQTGVGTPLPPGLRRQAEVERQRNVRPGAVAVSRDAARRRSLSLQAVTSQYFSAESAELLQSPSRRQSGAGEVMLEGELVQSSLKPEELKAQVRTMIMNEAIQANVVEKKEQSRWKKLSSSKGFWAFVCILLIGVVAGGIAIGAFAGGASSPIVVNATAAPTTTVSPSAAPSRSVTPSLAPSGFDVNFDVTVCPHFQGITYNKLFDEDPRQYEEEYLLVREVLQSNLTGFSVKSLRDDECSPANIAIWWLASTLNLGVSTLPLMERYGLAVLFFSLNAGKSRDPIGWFSRNSNECNWLGLVCGGGHLVGVDGSGSGLSGSIASEIGLLSNIRKCYACQGVQLDVAHLLGCVQRIR